MTFNTSKIKEQPFFGEGILSFKEHPVTLPQNDTAYSEDSLFFMGKMPKYNPDILIAKKGTRIYRQMMRDEQVKAVVQFKRDAITGRDFFWEVDRDTLGDEEADRRIVISQTIVDQCKGSWVDKLNGIMSSLYQGYSITEKIFKMIEVDEATFWGIKDLKVKPYETFDFYVDDFGNITKLVQQVNGRDIKLNMKKFIHFVNHPDYDEQYGSSELNEAYRSWFSKDMAIRFWNIWLEKHASGFRAITSSSDAVLTPGTALYTSLQSVLSNTVNGSGVILPKGIVMELHFPENNVAYKEAIDHHDLGIARALLVPNLLGITPSGQTGSYSQSDIQLEAFFLTLNADTKRLEEILNEDLFKQLGEINFGDDLWPRFTFHKMSDKQKMALATAWAAMISGGAAKRSDSDEAHIRDLLGIPEKDEETVDQPIPEGGDSNIPDGVLNDEEEVIVEDGDDEPGETLAGSRHKGKKAKDKEEEMKKKKKDKLPRKRAYALEQASKRVDFTVIAKVTDEIAETSVSFIAQTMDQLVADAILQMRLIGEDNLTSTNTKTIKFDKQLLRRLNKQFTNSLSTHWDVGRRNAENEIDKAKGEVFSMHINNERIEFVSKKYIQDKAFKVSGNLSESAMAIIQNILMNGVKGGKSLATMEKEIYQTFASKGMISQAQAKEALGEALGGGAVADARIATMIRTNGFEAVNESRHNFFTDPSLGDFVQAFEYSAILDARTTQICQHLDDQIHAADSEVWESYRPPNHFNCRSLLIPVTTVDEWTESDQPTINPQQGFA